MQKPFHFISVIVGCYFVLHLSTFQTLYIDKFKILKPNLNNIICQNLLN